MRFFGLFENPEDCRLEIVKVDGQEKETIAEIEASPSAIRCSWATCDRNTDLLRVDPGADVDAFTACPVHAIGRIIAIEEGSV